MTSPALAQLRYLRRLGFGYQPILDATGALDVAYYTRTWNDRLEVVLVYSESRARAYRLRPISDNDDPLHVDPAAIDCLIPEGHVVKVVHSLLAGLAVDGES